jgi:hypothetical protein
MRKSMRYAGKTRQGCYGSIEKDLMFYPGYLPRNSLADPVSAASSATWLVTVICHFCSGGIFFLTLCLI